MVLIYPTLEILISQPFGFCENSRRFASAVFHPPSAASVDVGVHELHGVPGLASEVVGYSPECRMGLKEPDFFEQSF